MIPVILWIIGIGLLAAGLTFAVVLAASRLAGERVGPLLAAGLLVALGTVPPSAIVLLQLALRADPSWAMSGPGIFGQSGGGPWWLAVLTLSGIWTLVCWASAAGLSSRVLGQAPAPGRPALCIRPELPEDGPGIERVNEAAFEGPVEAAMVARLRDEAAGYFGFVALLEGELVGHVAFSAMHMDPPQPELLAFGLAPLAVLPGHQGQGIGSRLVAVGLEACRAAGAGAVFVLGHPSYYPRFGFAPAAARDIESDYRAPEAFMALELVEGALNGVTGLAHYDPALEG